MAKKRRKKKARKYSKRRLRVVVALLSSTAILLFAAAVGLIYHTLKFTALVDARLQGEQSEREAWVYARPFELRDGQRLTRDELVTLLNDLGYAERSELADEPATFSVPVEPVEPVESDDDEVHILRRGEFRVPVSVSFNDYGVSAIHELRGQSRLDRVSFGSVPVTTLFGADRAKSRWVFLDEIPEHVAQAVLATEDQRFYSHTGLDPLGIARALVADLMSGELRQGGSTLTQQLVKNYFLTPERTWRRKILEAYLAVILESRAEKDDILELYLNDVYFGQRGSFGINGVEQASHIFFGKSVRNLTISQGALLAAVIRSPNASSPFRYPSEIQKRRDIVIKQMVRSGFIDETQGAEAVSQRLGLVEGTVDRGEAPYFVDTLRRELLASHDANQLQTRGLIIQSTMDRHLQNAAQKAVVDGLEEIRPKLPKSEQDLPQAALIALVPSTGDIVALVGARSYGTSQFNRALDAHRQPGSAFKPFVYLAAFESNKARLPTTMVVDEPTTFRQGGRSWTPQNYSRRFEGRVSYRRALALSLNVATARVGQDTGFENVVRLWESMGMSSRLEPYPSLVLGSFEVSPIELATAYAVLANGGRRVEPRFFTTLLDAGGVVEQRPVSSERVASPESTFLVTDMLRSVISFGTAREIRARAFQAQAAGKTGTTNDTRDAWFVGYTPDLLTAVWVGYDDNRALGLSGSQAALPIWTRFMKVAVSGKEQARFSPPPGIVFADIDPATGKRAGSSCPSRQREAFRKEAVPMELCPLH